MLRILLPVDGSPSAVRATQTPIDKLGWYQEAPSLNVVAVHLPVPSVPNMGSFVSKEIIQKCYDDDAPRCAPQPKPARGSWRALQVPFADRAHRGNHRRAGDARRLEHDLRGDARMSALANMALGSVTTRVLHLCHIPVVVIH